MDVGWLVPMSEPGCRPVFSGADADFVDVDDWTYGWMDGWVTGWQLLACSVAVVLFIFCQLSSLAGWMDEWFRLTDWLNGFGRVNDCLCQWTLNLDYRYLLQQTLTCTSSPSVRLSVCLSVCLYPFASLHTHPEIQIFCIHIMFYSLLLLLLWSFFFFFIASFRQTTWKGKPFRVHYLTTCFPTHKSCPYP